MLGPMTCGVCGQPLAEGARFCSNCGALVPTALGTDERKVVTILFADLVDSTGLSQTLDPERAREVLGGFFEAATDELQALRGRPEKFIGDAVMAVFGLPQVHEDDALRGVRAGLAIRARTRRLGQALGLPVALEVRVGVESGEAAAGIGPSGQLLVTGSVVNAAARLQTAASPGEVLVGETTHTLTEESVSYGERREVRVKGFDQELAAYPVEGLTTRSVRRTIPFVGRTSDLAILRQCLARVEATARPLLCTVLGEPGAGKSRLGDELVASLGPDVTVLMGRGQIYSDSATFAPVAAIMRELIGGDESDPAEKTRRRLREFVDRWYEGQEADRIADRLGLVLEVSPTRRDESAFVQDVQSGFVALIEGLARDTPVVLVFEDVHELRPAMLDLIERFALRTVHDRRKVLVLALARPELLDERPAWGAGAANHSTLRLEPLSAEDAVELVRQAGGGRIAETEAAEIAARAGGNPFFIVETTGMLLRPDGAPPLPQGQSLPPTVQAVVAARLDALQPSLRDLARRASVFLYSFGPRDLAPMSDGSVDDLRELEESEILVRDEGVRSTPHWRFRHEMLRDVAYASLPKRERQRLHELIAGDLLVAGRRSYAADHLERAAQASLDLDPGDRALPERATDELAAAGDRARRRMESRSAIDYYERALTMMGEQDRWGVREARVLAGMGEARYWLGEYPAATELLDRAVTLGSRLGDLWTLALAQRFLGDIAINVEADLEKAQELLRRSLEAAEEIDEPWAIARTLLFAGWVPWTRDRYAEAETVWRRALALAEAHDDRWARVRALTSLSINGADMGNYDEATRLIDEARALADEMGDQFSVAVTTVQRGRLHHEQGLFEESIPCFDRGVSIFTELGARWELGDALAARGIAERELGRLDEAEADLRQAVHISDELGERQLAGWTWRALASVAERRGDHAKAAERYRRAEEEDARRPR
jgi:class 3 adenylate cyclase/tetratricopeptide (TPR) repeat protein